MQAGMSTSRPLGEHATYANYLNEYPSDRTPRSFCLWATRHQLSPRKMIQIELEARAEGLDLSASGEQQRGMTFHPGMKSHTFHPGTMAHTFNPGSTMA
jgi:hypothetical protein